MSSIHIRDLMGRVVFPKGYGKAMLTIAVELITSTIREKKFYLAMLYFVIFPLFIVAVGDLGSAVEHGPGIALYEAHTGTRAFIITFYVSFFLGQIFLVILNADAISGEIEQGTFALLKTKPVHDSEIILGKFTGMLVIVAILDIPTLLIVYFTTLIRFGAKFPTTYIHTIDEIVFTIIIVILIQSIILSMSLLFSTIFNKSLYSILASMLALFLASQFSGLLSSKANYLSFQWLIDAILPSFMYDLPKIEGIVNAIWIILGVIFTSLIFLISSIIILQQKETE